MISELGAFFDIVKMGRKIEDEARVKGVSPEEIGAAKAIFGKARSISASANKFVIEYPVAISSSITDYKTALAITKQIELECARFIIMTSGLNPVINSRTQTISMYLDNIISSHEDYSGFKFEFTKPTEEDLQAIEDYMENHYDPTNYYESAKSRSSFSNEAVDVDLETMEDETDTYDPNNPANTAPDMSDVPVLDNTPTSTDGDTDFDSNIIKAGLDSNPYKNADMLNKMNKSGPTIINLSLMLDNNNHQYPINVPLAIKATLQFIDADDVKDIISNTNTNSRKLMKFIKLTSGQLRFFKDIVLELDNVKKDIKREKELSRYPFYRQLMSAKSRNKIKNVAQFVPFIKNWMAKPSTKEMPMCTIIMTTDELVDATGLHWTYIRSNKKQINNIIDTYMLLCFGVVDNINEVIYFYFSGVENPEIVKIADAGKKSGNDVDETKALMNSLIKYAIRR